MMRLRNAVFSASLMALAAGCGGAPTVPDPQWVEIVCPEKAGWRVDGLTAVDALLDDRNTLSMVVIDDGRMVYQYGDVSEAAYVASVRKSVLAMMYGPYVEDGEIDLDATLAELGVDDVEGLSDREKTATVRDVIAARSGVYHPAANGGDNSADAPARGSQAPGDYYLYNNWDFNVAGTIFERTTGVNIYDALEDELADPLDFEDFDRASHERSGDPDRSRHLAYHMNLSARDLARVGLLMLREGKWDGKRILSRDWVRAMTRPVTTEDEMNPDRLRNVGLGYGYMWWVFDGPQTPGYLAGAYAARGHFGQYILVAPAIDLVIAHKTRPVDYETPEEYDAVRVTWEEFLEIADAVAAARAPRTDDRG